MSINFCISPDELRKALKDIEEAENNGFYYCDCVFKLTSASNFIDKCRAEYSDLIEKAHPMDGNLDWGRMQYVTKYNKFIDGELVPIKDKD